jgi:hypothetical protein
MDVLFRCLVVIALALGVTALVGRPDVPEATRPERDPDDVRRISELEERVRVLEKRDVAPAPPRAAEGAAVSADVPEPAALTAAIDRRLDERMGAFRETLVRDYGLAASHGGHPTVVEAKPRTLEEIADEIGLNASEVDFIRAERRAAQREMMAIFKEEGETDEEFQERLKDLAADPERRAEATQKIVRKMMSEGGLAKVMTIKAKHDRAIRDRIGDDRYEKFRKLEGDLEGAGRLSLGLEVRTDTPDGGR